MTSYGYRTADGIEISIKPADDGGWCARAWFDGKNGAQYKEYAFGGTEQEAKDTVIENVHNHAQWHQPAPVASEPDTLTPDEVDELRALSVAIDFLFVPKLHDGLVRRGLIEKFDGKFVRITAAGREHLAALASTPVDVATDAEPDALIVSRQILREMLGFIQSELKPVPLDSRLVGLRRG